MKIRIYFDNMQDKLPANYRLKWLMRRAVEQTLKHENITCDTEVSITFTDNAEMKKLNMQYRSIDRATDVLSFPLCDDTNIDYCKNNGECGPVVLGDILISLERAREQAAEYGHSYEREVAFLCVHAMLHLLGYDHEKSRDDDNIMRCRQRNIIEGMGFIAS